MITLTNQQFWMKSQQAHLSSQLFSHQHNSSLINLYLLFSQSQKQSFSTLVILNHSFEHGILNALAPQSREIILVDGGANAIYSSNWRESPKIAQIIGDLDSVRPEVAKFYGQRGVKIKQMKEEDSNDYEKAMIEICTRNQKSSIVVLGALGGRLDHFFAQLSSTQHFIDQFTQISILLVAQKSLFFPLRRGKSIINLSSFFKKKNCTLITFGKADGISTKGLKWEYGKQLNSIQWGKKIYSSNYVLGSMCQIQCNGNLSFTIEFQLPEIKEEESF